MFNVIERKVIKNSKFNTQPKSYSYFFIPKIFTSRWINHSARINALSWTADSQYCASGSLDTHVYIWSVKSPAKSTAIKNAGLGGVNAVLWLDGGKNGSLVSAGADACVRVWDVKFPG